MSTTISGTNGVTFPDSTSMQTGQQACKAWVNFNGTGTVAIRAQYNVSSITDNGTGNYTVNFTNPMPDANYAAVGNHNAPSGGGASVVFGYDSPAYYSTSQLQLTCLYASSPYRPDASRVTIAIFS
jgi:hypothetical protein